MRHFDLDQWVDFSRGLDGEIDRPAMQAHLAAGCKRCSRVVEMLGGVVALARTDREGAPPASAVRLAKAIYTPVKPERLLARLIFDSFREPLLAGVRSQDRLSRRALYEAGNYYVDLRIEHQGAADLATLVGQLADRDDPGADPTDVRVELKSRKETLATAPCNRFGEFHLDYRPAPALRLDVCLGTSGKRLELPLGLMDESAARPKGTKGKPPRAD